MPRPEPIHPGARFADSTGREWRVVETLPGGKVDIVSADRTRLMCTYKRILRAGNWTRLPALTPSAESLSYGVRCTECGEWETSCRCT